MGPRGSLGSRPLGRLACALLVALQPATAAAATSDEEPQLQVPGSGGNLARRPDERRRNTGRTVDLFGHPVLLGGEWEASLRARRDFDLDPRRARDRDRIDQELKLEATTAPSPGTTLFLQISALSEIETRRDNGPLENTGALERGQMWLLARNPGALPFDLQLGRVSLVEPRSWWWDEDLDAARVLAGGETWSLDMGLARELLAVSTAERGVIDPEQDEVLRFFGHAAWSWRKRHTLEAYWLAARDGSGHPSPGTRLGERRADPSDADLTWLGLRAIGEERSHLGHRFGYWADLARVGGRETLSGFDDAGGGELVATGSERRDVRGIGWDVGARWSLPGHARPTLWLGWAVGSGSPQRGDHDDRAFRQTGLEENKGRFGGVKRFRYYGELLQPTLSNLAIASLGASLRFLDKSSLDLVFHDYRQRQPSDRLADSRLQREPTGESRALGQEVDLFLAVRESPVVEFTLSLATFRAGSAFGVYSGERAWYLEAGLNLNF